MGAMCSVLNEAKNSELFDRILSSPEQFPQAFGSESLVDS